MKTLLNVLFVFLAFSSTVFAQDYDLGNVAKVTANGGLVLRKAPSTNAEKITTIPVNTHVYYYIRNNSQGTDIDKKDFINNNSNKWRQVYYNGSYGYAFGAYFGESDRWDIAEKNMYGVISDNIPMYKEPYAWSDVTHKLSSGNEVYLISPKTLPSANKSVYVQVRYKDKVGYIDSQELTNMPDFRLLMEDKYMNEMED